MDKGSFGYITASVEDYKGKTGVVKVRVPQANVTAANAESLADYLATHSDARVTGFGLSFEATGDSTSTGKYDRVLQRLVYLFEDGNGNSRRFSLPAPRDEDVNDDQEPKSDTAEDVKDLLVSFGLTINAYNGGGLISRSPSKDARSKELTGV